jgi:hypothetical protein
MHYSNIDVVYIWGGTRRSCTVVLPIRDAQNAYVWLKAHFPGLEVLDTRKSHPPIS